MASPQNRAPVYQIDFTAVQSGKRIASSKRRIRWRFGFANPEAIAAGETGTACRGEEHDITFVWSITSGKRIVLADGQEVHYSSSRSNTFDFSWTMRGNHVLKLIAHANPPMSPTPGFRQYDFFVDGLSFFSFPKLFRLGLAPGDPRGHQGGGGQAQLAESSRRYRQKSAEGIASIEAPHNPDEEELYLQEAIRQSLTDNVVPKTEKSAENEKSATIDEGDLLDFGGPAPALPPSTTNPYGPPATALVPAATATNPYGAPTQSTNPYGAPAQSTNPYGQSTPSSASWGGGYGNYPGNDFTAPVSDPQQATTNPTSAGSAYTYGSGAPSVAGSNPFDPSGVSADASLGALVTAPPSSGAYSGASSAFFSGAASNPYGATSTTSSNPYGPASTATSNPYSAPPPSTADPFSASNAPTSNTYGAPAATATDPFGSSVSSNPYASNPYTGPSVGSNQFSVPPTSGYVVPAPISTNTFGDVPPAVTPKPQQTPSTLGFGSPPADFSFSSPLPQQYDTQNGFESHSDPVQTGHGLTMNAFSTQAESDTTNNDKLGGLDQAFSKLVNLDTFTIASKKDEKRSNPFESGLNSTIGGSRSLADIQKSKSSQPTKEIMRTPAPPPGAMVVSANQNGTYASQYGVQPPVYGGMQYGQPQPQVQQYGGGLQQPYGGAQPPQYGLPQQPPIMQSQQPNYGQPTYGQNPQAAYTQQPSGPYGQQQPPFGGVPPQQYGQAPQPQPQGFF